MTDTTPAEREAFEAWFIESRSPNDSRYMQRTGDGYVEFTLTVAWEAWQFRAASVPAQSQDPSLGNVRCPVCDTPLGARWLTQDDCEGQPAQQQAEPVAWIDPKSIDWLRENPQHRVLTTQLRGVAISNWMALYAAPPADTARQALQRITEFDEELERTARADRIMGLLRRLHDLVQSECPSMLAYERGGDSELGDAINAALEAEVRKV